MATKHYGNKTHTQIRKFGGTPGRLVRHGSGKRGANDTNMTFVQRQRMEGGGHRFGGAGGVAGGGDGDIGVRRNNVGGTGPGMLLMDALSGTRYKRWSGRRRCDNGNDGHGHSQWNGRHAQSPRRIYGRWRRWRFGPEKRSAAHEEKCRWIHPWRHDTNVVGITNVVRITYVVGIVVGDIKEEHESRAGEQCGGRVAQSLHAYAFE